MLQKNENTKVSYTVNKFTVYLFLSIQTLDKFMFQIINENLVKEHCPVPLNFVLKLMLFLSIWLFTIQT